MLPVQAPGQSFEGGEGTLLCQILIQQGIDLLNNRFSLVRSLINRLNNRCKPGNCGTCAGQLCKASWLWGWQERRDALPSLHSLTKNWRLACQTEDLGSLRVKDDGFWMAIAPLDIAPFDIRGRVQGASSGSRSWY
ncbi:hypothetical protein O77CONTIG1_00011 [Leptolyngbya sp. O-77]|nr:hypothetical protein O77CONTIG1_00011 [Leptolyngbya sp. O-77]